MAAAIPRPIGRSASGVMHINPLGRRGPLSAPVKIQARTCLDPFQPGPWSAPPLKIHASTRRHRFCSSCEKRADNLHEPEPEPEPENFIDLVEKWQKILQDAAAEMGIRETPNMFVTEKERISGYMKKMTFSSSFEDLQEMAMANRLFEIAKHALDVASIIMDIASLRRGTTQFSQHTTDQAVRTYAAILFNVAEDAYHKKFEMETFLSFLAALRCLVAIYRILVQDTVAKLKDGHLKNRITCHVSKYSHDFDKLVKHSEDEIVKVKPRESPWVVTDALSRSVADAQVYVASLADCRETALGYLKD